MGFLLAFVEEVVDQLAQSLYRFCVLLAFCMQVYGGAFASAWSDGAKRYTLEAAKVLKDSGQQVLTKTQNQFMDGQMVLFSPILLITKGMITEF